MSEQTKFVYNADSVNSLIYKIVKPTNSGSKHYWLPMKRTARPRRFGETKLG